MRKCIMPFTGLLCVCALTALLAACSGLTGGGDLIAYTVPRPDKKLLENRRVARVALYIDTAREDYRQILTDVGKYAISQEGRILPYFDYVILGGAIIKRDGSKPVLELSEKLRSLLDERQTLLAPLWRRGTKVLLGITGGKDGITFGAVATEWEHIYFARLCIDTCKFYGLEGIEFYDIDGESTVQSPYPEIGEYVFSGEIKEGEKLHPVPDEAAQTAFWTEGGGNMADLISHTNETLKGLGTFQGDTNSAYKWDFPLMAREVNYGRYIPAMVPRIDFEATSNVFCYSINDGPGFGDNDSGESVLKEWVNTWDYAPVIIDLAAITDEELDYFSERWGTRDWGTYEDEDGDGVDDDGIVPVRGDPQYGLVYYTNLGLYSPGQLNKLCVISVEIFGTEVTYNDL